MRRGAAVDGLAGARSFEMRRWIGPDKKLISVVVDAGHIYADPDILSAVEAFDILGDPVRRRILELLATGERSAGEVVDVVRAEFGLTQPAVSRQLRILRESGFADVRAEGTRRLYALHGEALDPVEGWLTNLRRQWSQRLDALETEVARGRHRTYQPSRRN